MESRVKINSEEKIKMISRNNQRPKEIIRICEIIRDSQGTWKVGDKNYLPTWPRGSSTLKFEHEMVREGMEALRKYYDNGQKHPSYIGVIGKLESENKLIMVLIRD